MIMYEVTGVDHDEAMRRVGERIRELRLAEGLTQERLAELCGHHATYIQKAERGQVNLSLKALTRVAGGLGVSVGDLVRPVDEGPEHGHVDTLLQARALLARLPPEALAHVRDYLVFLSQRGETRR